MASPSIDGVGLSILWNVFVGMPLPPGLQLGNTQTGFHPFIESSML